MAGAKSPRQARERAGAHPLVAAVIESEDIEHEDVPVPEWGGITLRVRGMDGTTRNAYEAALFHLKGEAQSGQITVDSQGSRHAHMLARCLYDPETNERLPFTPQILAAKSGAVLARLADIALRLSGMGPRSVRTAEGNSEGGQSGNSTSD